jgi:hypothetical protein
MLSLTCILGSYVNRTPGFIFSLPRILFVTAIHLLTCTLNPLERLGPIDRLVGFLLHPLAYYLGSTRYSEIFAITYLSWLRYWRAPVAAIAAFKAFWLWGSRRVTPPMEALEILWRSGPYELWS